MPAKLTGRTQADILYQLELHEELTTNQLAKLINRKPKTVHSSLLTLREQRVIRVCAYICTPGRGRETKVWALGSKQDAPRPDYKGEHRRAKQRLTWRKADTIRRLRENAGNPFAGLLAVAGRIR